MEGAAVALKSGYGDGYSDGDGYGYGDGYSDGDGYGDGYSDGDGYGYGYSDGDGYGYGYGYGYGDGDGYGYGDGDGDKATKLYFDALLKPHEKAGQYLAFWRSQKDGSPANGGTGQPAFPGLTQEVAGPLQLCGASALHATRKPSAWKGERWWIVALHQPVKHQDGKSGSLKRTIIADLGKCPFE